jgi:hypothetical protein
MYMNELVARLCEGKHPVAAERAKDAAELKESLDRGFILLKFTDTQGGTELGFKIDCTRSNFSDADFSLGRGVISLVGELVLNYDRVRIKAEIDVATLAGTGCLELLQSEADIRAQAEKASAAAA